MPRVIDRITYNKSATSAQVVEIGEGVMIILDPQEIRSVSDLAGQIAYVIRPDGYREELEIHHAEVHHGVVGLFFRNVDEARIPRLSVVTWESV